MSGAPGHRAGWGAPRLLQARTVTPAEKRCSHSLTSPTPGPPPSPHPHTVVTCKGITVSNGGAPLAGRGLKGGAEPELGLGRGAWCGRLGEEPARVPAHT